MPIELRRTHRPKRLPLPRDAPAMRKVLVAHLMRKRDTVLELMRTGQIYPQAHNKAS